MKTKTLKNMKKSAYINSYVNIPKVRSLEELGEVEDHHPDPLDEPKFRTIRLVFNIGLDEVILEHAENLAADFQNAGDAILKAYKEGLLPEDCTVLGVAPDSVETFVVDE